MQSFSEITGREKLIEIVRWFCVLPTAALGDFVASLVVRAVVRIASYGGLGFLGNSTFAYWFVLFLSYGPQKAVFVVSGSKMAPRRQLTSSIVLAVLGISLSLMTHVLGQHLAGNHVGMVNYSHLFAESAGLLSGAAYMVFQIARKRRKAITERPDHPQHS
jgi:hypothetical protein